MMLPLALQRQIASPDHTSQRDRSLAETTFQAMNTFVRSIEDQPDWQISGPLIRSRECTIYKACSVGAGLELAVKSYLAGINPMASVKQAEALSNCRDTMVGKEKKYAVPEMHAYDRHQGFLAMEWVAGRSLHYNLWTLSNKEQSLFRVGRWLRVFHEASGIAGVEEKSAKYLGIVEKRIGDHPARLSAEGPDHALFVSACECLRRAVELELSFEAPHAVSHGDFTPFNLMISKERVVGLDIWGTQRKPILDDLIRMMVYLTLAYPLLTRQQRIDSSNGFHQRISPLLDGYGLDLIEPDSLHFKIALLSEYLRRWLIIARRSRTFVEKAFDSYQLAQVKKLIVPLLDSIR